MNMKSLILILTALFLSTTSIADSVSTPAYSCQGENGLQYNFYTSYSEIHIYDEDGNDKGMIDSIQYEIKQLESLPPIISVVVNAEEGDTLASLSYTKGDTVAKGQIKDYLNAAPGESVRLECRLK